MLEHSKAFGGFSVDDIAAARSFYADTLGLRVTESGGRLTLHLAGGRDTIVYPNSAHVPAAFTILNFPVPDVDAAVDELTARGVVFTVNDYTDERGVQRTYGPPIAWFTDPAGNILSVIERAPGATGG